MRGFTRRMLGMLLVWILVAGALPALSAGSGWQSTEDGRWWYSAEDGSWPAKQWKQISGKWYYFDANGYMLTGWQSIGGKKYYLGEDGAMRTLWQQIGGSWYYLGEDGAMQTGWVQLSGSWYYLGSNGVMATGLQTINGKTYFLGDNGVMVTGLKAVNGVTYCFGTDGAALTGQQTLAGASFLFEEDGALSFITCPYSSETVDWGTLWSTVLEQEAWYVTEADVLRAGSLHTITHLWLDQEGAKDASARLTVWLCRNKTMTIKKLPRGDISRFQFLVDTEAVSGGDTAVVHVSETAPGKTEKTTSTDEKEKTTFYVWLEGVTTETEGGSGTGSGGSSGKSSGGSGRSSGGYTVTTHGRETEQISAGYDQISLTDLTNGAAEESMSTLQLSGTDVSLMLTRDGKPAYFVPRLMTWYPESEEDVLMRLNNTLLLEAFAGEGYLVSNSMSVRPPDGASDEMSILPEMPEDGTEDEMIALPEEAEAEDEMTATDALPVLERVPEGAARWSLNGATLRTLGRSGVEYLILKADGCAVVLPTEGFLAGTAYDEMKARGIPGRLFQVDVVISSRPTGLSIAPSNGIRILQGQDTPILPGLVLLYVTVEGETWRVTEDEWAELYQKNVLILPGEEITPEEDSGLL